MEDATANARKRLTLQLTDCYMQARRHRQRKDKKAQQVDLAVGVAQPAKQVSPSAASALQHTFATWQLNPQNWQQYSRSCKSVQSRSLGPDPHQGPAFRTLIAPGRSPRPAGALHCKCCSSLQKAVLMCRLHGHDSLHHTLHKR